MFDPWVREVPWRWKWQSLQFSCLENPMDRGAWLAVVQRVAKSQTQLGTHTYIIHTYIHISGKEFAYQCRIGGLEPWVRRIPWNTK